MRQQQLQMGQQQQRDQAALTQAWKNWDGKSPDSLIKGVLDNGGSGAAANQLEQQLMARQQQHLQLSEAEWTLPQKKTDRMLGRFTAAESVPDSQLAAHVQSALADSVTKGDLEPQEAQMGYQLLQQSGNDPKALRSGLDTFKKAHMLDSQIATRAKEDAETRKNTAEAAAKEQETSFYQQNPSAGAPGVSAETVSLRDYIQTPQNPGEAPHTPANYPAWKAQQEAIATEPVKTRIAQTEAQIHAQVQAQMLPLLEQVRQLNWPIMMPARE